LSDAAAFDVVLLDWPQTEQPGDFPPKKFSPLGKREEWTKPTEPLGSAGKANKPYAFASESGDYRWYVDPLAKKRGFPPASCAVPSEPMDPPRAFDSLGRLRLLRI